MADRKLLLVHEIMQTAARHLALDEVLLREIDRRGEPALLRLWECSERAVILGVSCSACDEVHLERCRQDGIPVLRRHTGGGVVLVGPGCISYSLILPHDGEEHRFHIRETTQFILGRMAQALRPLVPSIHVAGISDLAVGDRKVSGSAQRWLRKTLLHHGTFLYDFPLEHISRYLKAPAREPDYRGHREHADFVANLPIDVEQLRARIVSAWDASDAPFSLPLAEVEQLVATKYSRDEWNLKR